MPAFVPPFVRILPRATALALIAIGVAACSNSGRFDVQNPFASNDAPQKQQDVTGSVAARPAPSSKVASQPLPAPSRPQTIASGGVAQGAGGLGTYRPSTPSQDVTGSVTAERPQAPVGHWTWEGGTPVVVGSDETIDIIGRKYGVPAFAIMQANGLNDASQARPGQRLVIPRYVVAAAPAARPAQLPPSPATPHAIPAAAPAIAAAHPIAPELVHVVTPGESMLGISRKYGVSPALLAKANKIEVYAKLKMGDRLIIPGKHAEPARQVSAPTLAKPPGTQVAQAAPIATVPAKENVRIATPEPAAAATPAKAAEATGAMPSFRWPVHGRVISSFGGKTNGAQNDGINVAVPEGTPVKAAEDGVVAYAGNELKGYGNLVLVRHSNGYVSAYANASEIMVKRGDSVKRGQVIARAGQTGSVDSPQLHFEIRKGSTPVDPSKYLSGGNG
jgi:murein DD-endopeptidase MepM/ murein hydrolase activator NlpD